MGTEFRVNQAKFTLHNAVIQKGLRGEILRALREVGTIGLSPKLLLAHLKEIGAVGEDAFEGDLTEALNYLSMKELVSARTVRNAALGEYREIWTITAAGIDALEGTIVTGGIVL
jgi:hypothetical protein